MNAERMSQLHVLVVEDKTFVRIATGRILGYAGIKKIAYAADGEEAITYIAQANQRVDLVICDLVMPRVDGIEVVRHVAKLYHKPAFIFVSGTKAATALLATAVHTAQARGLRVLGAIEKPINIDAVRSLLTKFDGWRPSRAVPTAVPLTSEDLLRAIRCDEIILHYQPKVNLATKRIEGFESLVRWQHPDHGLIPPAQFVALAEEHGAIGPLTNLVLLLALRQGAAWNAAGLVTKLSVNISAHLLVDLGMPDRIAQLAAIHRVKPRQIVLEITETGVFRDAANTLDILARLHMKGFALSIDDFGTGYSSMEQLRRVPFAELKIDPAFVTGAAQNAKAKAILQSSVALGKNLGLSVVAEGAENQDDWDLLAASGVDMVQGFFVARPMPADQVLDWCRNWRHPQPVAGPRMIEGLLPLRLSPLTP